VKRTDRCESEKPDFTENKNQEERLVKRATLGKRVEEGNPQRPIQPSKSGIRKAEGGGVGTGTKKCGEKGSVGMRNSLRDQWSKGKARVSFLWRGQRPCGDKKPRRFEPTCRGRKAGEVHHSEIQTNRLRSGTGRSVTSTNEVLFRRRVIRKSETFTYVGERRD